MKYGVSCPNFDDPELIVELAVAADRAGWDGFFLWDHVKFLTDIDIPIVDPWVTLGAVAARTERVRLGPLVTPLPRRRPWKVARESVTLDHLAKGRSVLGVGAGWPPDADFELFGEEGDLSVRATKLDEALEIVAGLMSGVDFSFAGTHYTVGQTRFIPVPLQRPRIPVWVAGTWRHRKPLMRAVRWDGVVPLSHGENPPVEDLRALVARCAELRPDLAGFDIVLSGTTRRPGSAARSLLQSYERAGATWWLETTDGMPGWHAALSERILLGPPHSW